MAPSLAIGIAERIGQQRPAHARRGGLPPEMLHRLTAGTNSYAGTMYLASISPYSSSSGSGENAGDLEWKTRSKTSVFE